MSGYKNESRRLPVETHVLQSDSIITFSDYQQQKLAESYKKLLEENALEQKRINIEADKIRFYNLSLKDFGARMTSTWAEIFQELYLLLDKWQKSSGETTDWGYYGSSVMNIVAEGDRMIYVGVFFIILGLLVYFFFLPEQ